MTTTTTKIAGEAAMTDDEMIALAAKFGIGPYSGLAFAGALLASPAYVARVRYGALRDAENIARLHDLGTPDGHAIADSIRKLAESEYFPAPASPSGEDAAERSAAPMAEDTAEPEHSAIYISKRLTGSDKDAPFVQAHINQAVSEAMEKAAETCESVAAQSKNSLFRSGAKICAGEIRNPTQQCDRPPEGWQCSRVAGHDGPCAASQVPLPRASEQADEADFKNFHRLLCERFGYVHDEADWKRDQLSLIEHIASKQTIDAGRYSRFRRWHPRLQTSYWTGQWWEPIYGEKMDACIDGLDEVPQPIPHADQSAARAKEPK